MYGNKIIIKLSYLVHATNNNKYQLIGELTTNMANIYPKANYNTLDTP